MSNFDQIWLEDRTEIELLILTNEMTMLNQRILLDKEFWIKQTSSIQENKDLQM